MARWNERPSILFYLCLSSIYLAYRSSELSPVGLCVLPLFYHLPVPIMSMLRTDSFWKPVPCLLIVLIMCSFLIVHLHVATITSSSSRSPQSVYFGNCRCFLDIPLQAVGFVLTLNTSLHFFECIQPGRTRFDISVSIRPSS